VTFIDNEMIIGFDRPKLEQALAKVPKAEKPPFGASIADASKVTAQKGKNVTLGAYIGGIRPGSLAEKIGLKVDDIVTSVNGQRITRANDMEMALARLQTGSRLDVTFHRGLETKRVEGIV
jgi:S1-C subfamily serine protease